MDIALKTLVLIIFILVPGFIFRRVYFQGNFSKQFDSKSWSHSLFYSALFGIILNFITYNLYQYFFLKVDYSICLKFYNSISKESIEDEVIEKFNITSVYKYLSLLYGSSIILGWLIYIVIRNLKLDRYFEPLRFLNHWHYYFKGEIKDFREFSLPKGKCSVTTVDILVKSEKNGNNLYSGLLSSYSLDNNGNLESISLTKAKIFKNERKEFKDIHSHVFIIPNSNILNINLRYTFEEEDSTILDFITSTTYVALIIILWVDSKDIFTEYTLISKIFLKLLASFAFVSIPLTIDTIYSYFDFNAKEELIPDGANSEMRRHIEELNTWRKLKRKQLLNDILIGPIIGVVLFSILALIIVITR